CELSEMEYVSPFRVPVLENHYYYDIMRFEISTPKSRNMRQIAKWKITQQNSSMQKLSQDDKFRIIFWRTIKMIGSVNQFYPTLLDLYDIHIRISSSREMCHG